MSCKSLSLTSSFVPYDHRVDMPHAIRDGIATDRTRRDPRARPDGTGSLRGDATCSGGVGAGSDETRCINQSKPSQYSKVENPHADSTYVSRSFSTRRSLFFALLHGLWLGIPFNGRARDWYLVEQRLQLVMTLDS